MRYRYLILSLLSILVLGCSAEPIQESNGFEHFIRAEGDRLLEGDQEYRFISYNIPNILMLEDEFAFDNPNVWRLPNSFELEDAVKSVELSGGQVIRSYVLTVRRPEDGPEVPRHVEGPGQFGEEAFRTLDTLLAVAEKHGVRLIIPFVDNWPWMGGRADYTRWHEKDKDDFWTDEAVISDFKKTIHYTLNRINTVTGKLYKDEKAILAWETGNELQSTPEWVKEIAAYIKSLDSNHLVIDGYHSSHLRQESIDDPNIDLVTTHHYDLDTRETIRKIRESKEMSRGKKPYFLGEFGFVPTIALVDIMDEVIDTGISGALIWSLRFHRWEGGFYWHSEPMGHGLYKAYHYPGFQSGDAYDELGVVPAMRAKAFEIQGKNIPEIVAPDPPILLPISNPLEISWRGSTGASSYRLERAESRKGPWSAIADRIDDASRQYTALYSDATAEVEKTYYYRLFAQNISGRSSASNLIGPVAVSGEYLRDEFETMRTMYHFGGSLRLVSRNDRKFKEDISRLQAEPGSWLLYKIEGSSTQISIEAFQDGTPEGIALSVSRDGQTFDAIPGAYIPVQSGLDAAYGYFQPFIVRGDINKSDYQWIKIDFSKQTELSRLLIGGERQ